MTLPTPPTLEQRLDAAARYWAERMYAAKVDGVTWWPSLSEADRQSYRDHVEGFCRAFAPEHFKDTDTTTGKD